MAMNMEMAAVTRVWRSCIIVKVFNGWRVDYIDEWRGMIVIDTRQYVWCDRKRDIA